MLGQPNLLPILIIALQMEPGETMVHSDRNWQANSMSETSTDSIDDIDWKVQQKSPMRKGYDQHLLPAGLSTIL